MPRDNGTYRLSEYRKKRSGKNLQKWRKNQIITQQHDQENIVTIHANHHRASGRQALQPCNNQAVALQPESTRQGQGRTLAAGPEAISIPSPLSQVSQHQNASSPSASEHNNSNEQHFEFETCTLPEKNIHAECENDCGCNEEKCKEDCDCDKCDNTFKISVITTQRSSPSTFERSEKIVDINEISIVLPNDSGEQTNQDKNNKCGRRSVPASEVSGRRIIDLKYFISKLREVQDHSLSCRCRANMVLTHEVQEGLRSRLHFECDMCNLKTYIYTEDPKGMNINTDAVRGVISGGCGQAQLNDFSAGCNLPPLSNGTYQNHQAKVSKAIHEVAEMKMRAAIEEEKKLAIEAGDVTPDGIPLITVVCDGAWAKRSYRINFTSLSGVAAIVGYRTGKVLYFGVKNKYCMVCHRAANKGVPPKDHACYKNYGESQSSSSMEAAIIVEGFCSSLEDHGVIYNKMVADGDSSVYAKVVQARPYKDVNVIKIECRNHLLRNYLKKLRLVAETGSRIHHTGPHRRRIGANLLTMRVAVTAAIRFRKQQDTPFDQQISDLKKDILNSPYHIYGDHSNCSRYFCTGQSKENEKNYVYAMQSTVVWDQMYSHIKYLANHAKSLICDLDNNPCEHYNSHVARYTFGKLVNHTQRSGYNMRCAAAVIAKSGAQFHTEVHKILYGKSPGIYTKMIEATKRRRNRVNNIRKRNKNFSKRRINFSSSATFDPDYGEHAISAPPLTEEEYKKARDEFLETKISKTNDELVAIEARTKKQRDNEEWCDEHRQRLTSSLFYSVCSKRPTTSCHNIVFKMLYNTTCTEDMAFGVLHEKDALDAVKNVLKIDIREAGLFLHPTYNYLGASPDGLVDNDTTVEVKCAAAAAKLQLSPEEGIRNGKIKFWKYDKETNTYIVNKKHPWYFQVQGTLNICDKEKCIFAVWTPYEPKVKIEIIHRDIEFWRGMIEKLKLFYMDCVLPEILDPSYKRSGRIKDPYYIIEAQEQQSNLAVEKKNQKKRKLSDVEVTGSDDNVPPRPKKHSKTTKEKSHVEHKDEQHQSKKQPKKRGRKKKVVNKYKNHNKKNLCIEESESSSVVTLPIGGSESEGHRDSENSDNVSENNLNVMNRSSIQNYNKVAKQSIIWQERDDNFDDLHMISWSDSDPDDV